MKVLSFFSPRPDSSIKCEGGLTQQHFKDACDLNVIIKRYPDGIPSPAAMPVYGDFTAIGKGLQDSMNAFQFVSDWFYSLPSDIRSNFDNDPLKAQTFVLDHPDKAVELGILSASKPAKPDGVAVIGAEKGAVAEPLKAATTTSAPAGAAEQPSA